MPHKTWVVCHRNHDHGHISLYAFSSSDNAYLHAARLIADEIHVLVSQDEITGLVLVTAIHDGLYEDAVRLFHQVNDNLDSIDVTCLEVDQLHLDMPLALVPQ